MKKNKKYDAPGQLDLFAETTFARDVFIEKKPDPLPAYKTAPAIDEKDIFLRFAKTFKHSFAFVEAVLNGLLPGDYHGSLLWLKKIGRGINGYTWIDVCEENPDYWIDRGYRLFYSANKTVSIIKLKSDE